MQNNFQISRRGAVAGLGGLALMSLVPQAHAQGKGLVVQHAKGETRLPAAPRRVAVFDLAALDTLQALGVEVAAVPKANFPAHLNAYSADRYTKAGSLFEPDEAALRALKPDLIIVGSRSASKYAEMSAIAPTIDLSTSTQSFLASVTANMLTLGRIFNRQALAAARAEELLVAARGLQTKAEKAGKGLLLFVAGQGMSAQVAQTRFGIVYELIGITPAVVAADLPPPRARGAAQPPAPAAGSPEAAAAEEARRRETAQRDEQFATLLARVQPDWLFVLDRNAATGGQAAAAKLLAASSAIQQTPAWSRQRVVHLDAPGWYLVGGGYGVLQNTIAQVSEAFDKLA
jgi:iron complex transport system substrate-binding protein